VSATTRIGTEVAGYRLERVLGRGGMSVVYLAEHLRLGRKVALKLLDAALSEDESYRERFIRESRRAAELDHPNVIPIYDAGEEYGQLYLAMRYVEGCDLKELIRRQGSIPLGRTLFILEQVASALDAAHERDLIHRDVKPSNILVAEPSDRVYLTDFGVVKHTASRGLTRTGFFIGTVDYAAPEQIEGLPLDPTTDVYALGCVFYECMTGRPPYDREGEVAVMHAHLTEPPPPLTAARPDLPKALNRVLATAMAKAMGERYPSCEAFVVAARNAALHRVAAPAESPSVSLQREVVRSTQPPAEQPVSIVAPPPSPPEPAPPAVEATSAVAAEAAPAAVAAATAAPTAEAMPATPPVEPVAAAAAPPAVVVAAPSQHRRRLSPSVLNGVLAVAALVASAFAVYFATTRKSSSPPVTNPTSQSAAPAKGIAALVPAPLFRNSCTVQRAPLVAGAVQSLICTPPRANAQGRMPYYPDRWEASIFPSATALHKAYNTLRAENDIGTDYGACTGTSWGGEGRWVHGPGKPGGRRFCYFDGNVAVVVWTHEKLGQASHIDLLGIARQGGSDHPSLFGWWRFWHHKIGKCEPEGCTARLP
jgi:serine/threonine protein kinase